MTIIELIHVVFVY